MHVNIQNESGNALTFVQYSWGRHIYLKVNQGFLILKRRDAHISRVVDMPDILEIQLITEMGNYISTVLFQHMDSS